MWIWFGGVIFGVAKSAARQRVKIMSQDPKYAVFFGATAQALRQEGCKVVGYIRSDSGNPVPLWQHEEAGSFRSGNRITGAWMLLYSNHDDIDICFREKRHLVAKTENVLYWQKRGRIDDLSFLDEEDPSIVD